EERRVVGRQLNELKNYVEAEIEKLQSDFAAGREAEQLAKERIDVTLPGRRIRPGHLHPITLLRQKIEDIFVSMGYEIEDGPETEPDSYTSAALNIPPNPPAPTPQDPFSAPGRLALRPQPSTMQIHAMQKPRPPLRVAAPGRVFRRDTP